MPINTDYGNNPRNFFVNSLIHLTNNVRDMIYLKRDHIIYLYPALKSIIGSLNEESQKELKPIYDKITKFEKRECRVMRTDIEDTYNEIMRYLHTGYLKEVNYAAKPLIERRGKLKVPQR